MRFDLDSDHVSLVGKSIEVKVGYGLKMESLTLTELDELIFVLQMARDKRVANGSRAR